MISLVPDDSEMASINPQGIALSGGLYLVPTPIGNLRDITLRALDVLQACEAVICEDTRVTGKLLAASRIAKRKIVYNDHSTEKDRDAIIEKLSKGAALAFVSDAGTPLVSDPGYKLVKACLEQGIPVTALPGASALLPALQLSGLPPDRFLFGGFLPTREKALIDALDDFKTVSETLVFYETAKRLDKTLAVIRDVLGDRDAAIIREISKLYEEAIRGRLTELIAESRSRTLKGEIVLVIAGAGEADEAANADAKSLLKNLLAQNMSVRDAVAQTAALTGLRKKDVYALALAMQESDAHPV